MATPTLDWIDKINNPDLVAFLEQYGSENYLTAEEINQLRDFVNALSGNKINKIESQDFVANYGAITVIDHIDLTDERSSISLVGSATDVKSVQVSGEYIRPGKPHYFKNRTSHNVKLWHLAGTGNIKYFFPNGLDLIVKPNEVIEFNTNANDSASVRFEYVGGAPSVDVTGNIFSKIVYVNSTNPNSATIFDTENPPLTNDNSLKSDVNNFYVDIEGNGWVYNSASSNYTTNTALSNLSNFYLADTTVDAVGNKTVAIYRIGKMGVGGSPKAGKFEILIDPVYSTNMALVPYGTIGFGNDSASAKAPTIFSRSNDSIGLTLMAATNDINGTDDMRFDVRRNNNTDFSTLTSIAFRFTRLGTTLLRIFRNGIINIPSLSSAGTKVVVADSTGNLGLSTVDFQAADNQVEVSSSGNVQNSWHGQTILFTANSTQTVPATLMNALDFTWRTLPGVTVTWAITSPFTWETTPTATPEKTVGHFMRRGSTNTIILDV